MSNPEQIESSCWMCMDDNGEYSFFYAKLRVWGYHFGKRTEKPLRDTSVMICGGCVVYDNVRPGTWIRGEGEISKILEYAETNYAA